jgi:hypothetical protein
VVVDAQTAKLTIWDQRSERTGERQVACPSGCRQNLGDIMDAAVALLDLCFTDRCASTQLPEKRPTTACDDFPSDSCPALPLPSSISVGGSGMDPKKATTIEALTAVGVAIGLGTSVGFGIANHYATSQSNGNLVKNLYENTALAAGGITIGLAGLAVPIFIIAETAKRRPPSLAANRVNTTEAPIACPSSSRTEGRSNP